MVDRGDADFETLRREYADAANAYSEALSVIQERIEAPTGPTSAEWEAERIYGERLASARAALWQALKRKTLVDFISFAQLVRTD